MSQPSRDLAMIVHETKRLMLRRPLLNDLDALGQIYSDKAAARCLGEAPSLNLLRQLIIGAAADYERDGTGLLSVIDQKRGEVVGQCGVQRMELDEMTRRVLCCVMHPGVRRQGFATEAAQAVRDKAGSDPLHAIVEPDNPGGLALAANLGFVETGEVIIDGRAMKLFVFSGEA